MVVEIDKPFQHRVKRRKYDNHVVHYRPDTSDPRVLDEVITQACYHKPTLRFDVEEGEHWLDLGANIGAFAVYCALQGATCESYEPQPDNFQLLTLNLPPHCTAVQSAVSGSIMPQLYLWSSTTNDQFSRPSIVEQQNMDACEVVDNTLLSNFPDHTYDGIKMDIEGSEFGILDKHLIPACRKLVLEYHSSRDPSADHLKKRLDYLRQRFDRVNYPAELDRIVQRGGTQKTFFDRLVFCTKGSTRKSI